MPELRTENHIVIRGFGSVSPLGHNFKTVSETYQKGKPAFQYAEVNNSLTAVGALKPEAEAALSALRNEKRAYQTLDRSVLMGMYAAREAVAQAGWKHELSETGVNLGSSRGAVNLLENDWAQFREHGQVPVLSSPTTTLGNLSSWVAQDLAASGPVISHSITCSTALQAIANGFAWLKAGMANKFLAGGTEAPLTPFTIAQMKALKIYSDARQPETYPCRPHNPEKRNTFVLGEGAAVFALEMLPFSEIDQLPEKPFILEGIGFGTESISSKTGISEDGQHFQKAMQNALKSAANTEPIDVVIMHAPGTAAGDAAELKALENVFGKDNLPALTSNKFLIGHTLGASAALSLEYALYILKNQHYLEFPHLDKTGFRKPAEIKRILIMAAGFGGNASALIVRQGL